MPAAASQAFLRRVGVPLIKLWCSGVCRIFVGRRRVFGEANVQRLVHTHTRTNSRNRRSDMDRQTGTHARGPGAPARSFTLATRTQARVQQVQKCGWTRSRSFTGRGRKEENKVLTRVPSLTKKITPSHTSPTARSLRPHGLTPEPYAAAAPLGPGLAGSAYTPTYARPADSLAQAGPAWTCLLANRHRIVGDRRFGDQPRVVEADVARAVARATVHNRYRQPDRSTRLHGSHMFAGAHPHLLRSAACRPFRLIRPARPPSARPS